MNRESLRPGKSRHYGRARVARASRARIAAWRSSSRGAFDHRHVDHLPIERPRAAAGGGMDGVLLHNPRRLRDFFR